MSLAESEPSSPSRAGAERILEGRFPGREDDARALLPPASLGAVVSRMRDLLRGRSALVVLDIPSSDTPLDGTRLSALKRVVSTLLECGNRQRSSSADRGVHVLVTSQVPIGALGTQVGQAFPERVHLCEPLNRDESVTLLHNLAPFDPYTPPALIAQLVDECVDVNILVLCVLLCCSPTLSPFSLFVFVWLYFPHVYLRAATGRCAPLSARTLITMTSSTWRFDSTRGSWRRKVILFFHNMI